MRWVRRGVWALAGVLVVLSVAVAAGFIWLDSRSGKSWLEATINQAAEGSARVTGIGGRLPFHPTVARVELSDSGGTWANLTDIRLDIAPWDLLRRRVTVERLSAASIDIQRLPQANPDAPPPPPSDAPAGLPQLPVSLDVQRLAIDTLSLPAELLGETTVWTITAAAQLVGRDVGLALQIDEHGPSPLRADVQFALSDTRAGAHVTLDDPRGLLLQHALGEALPLHVRLADDPDATQGPADWRGRLAATLGDRARLAASLRLAADPRRLETQGTLAGTSLLPPELAPLVGDTLTFHIAAREKAGGITLDTLALEGASFEAAGEGSYRPDDNHIEASVRLAIPDLDRLSSLAGQPLAGAVALTATAKGPIAALHAEAELAAHRVLAGTAAVEELRAKLEADTGPNGYSAKGSGRLAGVRLDDQPLPAHLGDAVDWRLTARADGAMERLVVSEFDVASAGISISADGFFDRAAEEVNATLRLRLDELRRFADMAGTTLSGRGQVTAAVAGKISGPLDARADGGFDDLVTGIPAADALIGGRLRLDIRAQRDAGGRVRIEEAGLALAAARATARGTLEPDADRLDGEVTATLDNLAVLQRAGLPVQGRVRLEAQASGRLSAPALDARLAGSGLAWEAMHVDRLTARLRGKLEDTPSGTLAADLQAGDLALRIDGQAALSRDRKVVNVSQLRLRSGASVIEARLRTVLDTLLTSGQITANIPDLAPWSSLAGMDLGGRLNLNLALSTPRSGQAAEFTLAGDELRLGPDGAEPIAVRRLAANGALSDLLRRPTGRIEANGANITVPGGRLDTLRLAARSHEPNRFAFDAASEGDFNGRFAVTTAGDVALDRGATRVTLRQLAGKLLDTPVQLRRPLLVTAAGADLAVADLSLAIGNGTIEGRARRDASRLDVDLTARQLPLGLAAALAGRSDIHGAVDMSVALAGPAAQPRGRVTLDGRDLRAGPARRGQPKVGFSAAANVMPSQVELEASASANGVRLLSATGTVPVVFGPAPGAVALAERRPLSVRVRGEGELSTLADFLPLAGDRLAGAFRLALDADGPVAEPRIAGELSLDRGRYENRASGLLIDALTLHVTADRDRVELRRLAATDGGKGRLEGNGTVRLNGGASPAADATITIAGFRALRRADAKLVASGSTTIKGPVNALNLVARITVDEAEFFIPDPPPTSAKKIPVTVIDSSTGQVLERPEPPAPASDGVLSLDVTIHVPGRTFIRGRGLDSEWEGDIRVQGNSAAPELIGALKVARGKFAFFGKDLALSRGTVTFTGGTKIEPDLDVLAETNRFGTTFQVGAAGTPDALKIKLSSIPPLPEDEILSRMLFDREMTRLTPAQGLQLAQAAATLSSGGPGVLDKIRQKLGLDTLNVGSTDNDSIRPSSRSDPTGGSGAMGNTGVSGGKYVADGVYVGAEQRLSGETRSKVEIEVLPNVNVESTAGTRGESIGLNWKKDY